MCRATHQVRLAGPSRLVARVRSHTPTQSSYDVASRGWSPRRLPEEPGGTIMAALLTSTSTRPRAVTASAASRATACGSARSAATRAWPSPSSEASTSSARSRPASPRWWTTTRSPRAAKARATAAPTPRDEPVTRTPRDGVAGSMPPP